MGKGEFIIGGFEKGKLAILIEKDGRVGGMNRILQGIRGNSKRK